MAEALRRVGRDVIHIDLPSTAGHDSFLVDHEAQTPIITEFLLSQHEVGR
jgi:homoserine acetyltransferase